MESNSVEPPPPPKFDRQSLQAFNTRQQGVKPYGCMYCEETSHKRADCPQVSTLDGRKKILAEKTLCFNCTEPRHRAGGCVSKMSCELCSRRHHTSICNEQHLKGESAMSSCGDDKVVYPVVVVKVGGIECCDLLDSGASSCYASANRKAANRDQTQED